MPKKKSRKVSSLKSRFREHLRRIGVTLFTAVVVAFQASSCVYRGENGGPTAKPSPDTASVSFSECPQFFAAGIPPVFSHTPKLRALCFGNFAVLHSGITRTPMFVAERLNRQILLDAHNQQRTNRFYAEPRLPRDERAELTDYRDSGYARGHMAPAANMPTTDAMEQSFSLANVVPQNAKNNSGAWSKIEQDTRSYVMRAAGDVYVITAPIYQANTPTVGSNQVQVPTYLFKLVYDPKTQKSWAHWQQNSSDTVAGRPISYGELEQRTGIDWLPGAALQ